MTVRGVLVAGATGTQGSAVVEQLLAAPRAYDVFALTRDPSADAARDLADRGVTLLEGDLERPATLVDAMVDAKADVGRFVTHVLTAPEQCRTATVPLVGTALTLTGIAGAFEDRLHGEVQPVHIPLHTARMRVGEAYAALFEWYNEVTPLEVSSPLGSGVVDATPLSAYLSRSGWGKEELPGQWEPARVQ
jgi:NAD(P)-dependent dehydrogenase (short-subunit alcohol dehydrogenase family)